MVLSRTIFEYDDYRQFLKDMYSSLKAKDHKFSFRYFARIAGFNSHNFLRLVMIGQSNLSPESIEKFSKAFKLNQEESDFFKNLVLFNQAATNEEKKKYADSLLRSKTYRRIYPLREAQYQYFKHWYYTAIRELVGLPSFKEDYKWMAERVVPAISPAEAKKAVGELLKLGLLNRDANGNLVRTAAIVSTPDEVMSSYVTDWHREAMKRASESIDTVKREEREISAVYLSFNKKHMKILKEMVHQFRKEVLKLENSEGSPDAVYQVNIQIFPIAKVEGEDA